MTAATVTDEFVCAILDQSGTPCAEFSSHDGPLTARRLSADSVWFYNPGGEHVGFLRCENLLGAQGPLSMRQQHRTVSTAVESIQVTPLS